MVKNTKAKGNRNEHRGMTLFSEYSCTVMRSAASLGAWDFIAYNHRHVFLVQVKTNNWVPKQERLIMEAEVVPYNAHKVQLRFNDYQKLPDIRVFVNKKWVNITTVEVLVNMKEIT